MNWWRWGVQRHDYALESNHARQEQFVSNASHELKTPLTIIESYASLLKRRGLDRPELFMESVEAIHSEAIRMKEMTERRLPAIRINGRSRWSRWISWHYRSHLRVPFAMPITARWRLKLMARFSAGRTAAG